MERHTLTDSGSLEMDTNRESSGVEELIQRLREQGVAEGRSRADELFEEARDRAEQRMEKSRREAEAILEHAREEARRTRAAGEEAVRLAVRDAMLRLKSELVERFADRVRRLVTRELSDEALLRQLILEVGGRAAPPAEKPAKVLLPKDVVGLDQLRRTPEEVKEGTLSHFIVAVTKDMLREGLEIGERDDDAPGLRIQLQEDDVEIDLTDKAVAELLLRHLVPRFRAMMEGIIQ
jgi:V/A-type H+/Na+-transporting ATPase subunit E